MVRQIEYKDPGRLELIKSLESASKGGKPGIWSAVVQELSRARRNRREVNVHRINKHTVDGDVVVIPGKVLGDGALDHKVDVAAYKFTAGAEQRIKEAGGKTMSISELVKKNPKGSKVKLIG
jgi:large subunit ribosomal protein L18e